MKIPSFKNLDNHLQEILSKGIVTFILKILGAGLAFLLQLIIARYLGAAGSGIYFLALTIITLVATVSRLGMDNSVTRFVAAYKSENDWSKVTGVVNKAIWVTVLLSLIFAVASFFSANFMASVVFHKPDLSEPLQLMSLVIVPLAVMSIYAKSLQGLKRARDTMLMQSVLVPLIACTFVFFLVPIYGITGAVFAYGIGVIFTMIFGIFLWQKAKSANKEIQPDFPIKQLLTSSIPLLGALLLQQLASALPLMLLGVWGTTADVGLFGAAQRTGALVSLVLIAANVIIAPKLAELYQQNKIEALGRVARQGALIMTCMALPIVIVFMFFSNWVMGLFGSEFSSSGILLVIIALGQLVNVMTGSVALLLAMTGNEKSLLSANILAFILSGILCVILIPTYTSLGAAIAISIPLALVNLLRVRFVWQTMGVMTLPFVHRWIKKS